MLDLKHSPRVTPVKWLDDYKIRDPIFAESVPSITVELCY